MYVCERHVKDGLKVLNLPHIKKLHEPHVPCSFSTCSETAAFKLFLSSYVKPTIPFSSSS